MDTSLDTTILMICRNLYAFSSETRVNLISEILDDSQSPDGVRYICSVVIVTGSSFSDILCEQNTLRKIDGWTVQTMECMTSIISPTDAKKLMLDRLLFKCKSALEVPIKGVMDS